MTNKKCLKIYVSDEEKEELEKLAKVNEMSISKFLKVSSLSDKEIIIKQNVNKEINISLALDDIYSLVNEVSECREKFTLISNMILRQGKIYPREFQELEKSLSKMEETLNSEIPKIIDYRKDIKQAAIEFLNENKENITMKTENQWNKEFFKVREYEKEHFIKKYNHKYYKDTQVIKMTDSEIEQYKNQLLEERKFKQIQKQQEEELLIRQIEKSEQWKTVCQWLDNGYIPKKTTKWLNGKTITNRYKLIGKSEKYYYAHIDDMEKDEIQANSIKATFSITENYNGLPWW